MAAPYIVGCLTGFLLSAFLFNVLSPSLSVSSLPLATRFASPMQQGSYPLSQNRQFLHSHSPSDEGGHSIPHELDMSNAIIHANHSTAILVQCFDLHAPTDSIIVPTRSHPTFAITVLVPPKWTHTTSQALLEHGVDDVHVLHVAAPLFHGECGGGQGRLPGLVVVQQADVGFLGMYAASVGCPVLMLESRGVMRKALQTTLCANPEYKDRVWVEGLVLNEGKGASDGSMVRSYVGIDAKEGQYREEDVESRFDCTQPDNAERCQDLPSISLSSLLSNNSPAFPHLTKYPGQSQRPIFFLQLSGDANSVRSLLAASESVLSKFRVYHVMLPFRPHLLGVQLAGELLREMERLGYEIAEIPYIPPESSFSLFQSVKSLLASSFSSLASYTRPLKYDEVDTFAEKVFECGDKRGECRVDLLFSLMSGRFVAGIVPFKATEAPG